jgi:hypothetical protein
MTLPIETGPLNDVIVVGHGRSRMGNEKCLDASSDDNA